jgi:uncharacterized protein (TIGR03437 family)
MRLLVVFVNAALALHAQAPKVSAVTNAASLSPIVGPGALVAILGDNLGNNPATTSVTIGGLNAPVVFASDRQVIAQVALDMPAGPTSVVVAADGGISLPFDVTIAAHSLAIFTASGRATGPGVFTNEAGQLTRSAEPGQTITGYLTGLGANRRQVMAGAQATSTTAPACVTNPTLSVGGTVAQVLSACLSGNLTGVYAVKFVVPSVAPGDQSVIVSVDGTNSSEVTLTVGSLQQGSVADGPIAAIRGVQPMSWSPGSMSMPVDSNRLAAVASPGSNPPSVTSSVHGTINYVCDATVNAVSGLCNTLNTSIANIYANAFTNANASIYVKFGATALGMSNSVLNLFPYSTFRSALIASESGPNDTTAVTDSVPPTNPFNTLSVALTNANARALGLSATSGFQADGQSFCALGDPGCYDAVITASSAIQTAGLFYFRAGSINSDQYDFFTVVEHETDEVLGTGSCGFQCVFGGGVFAFTPADLFRYQSNGARTNLSAGNNNSCSSSNADNACFSIDGIHMLEQYNNVQSGGDAGDWVTNCPGQLVQNAALCAGIAGIDISPTAEIEVLDVVGFTTGTPNVPSAVSVAPSSGSGASQTFALTFSDTSGAASFQFVYAYFNATLANPPSNSCFLYYNVAANQINLINDAVTAWMAATPGAATTLQNSQCSLNVATSSVTLNGNTLTLNLAMTFQPAFAGAKNIYLYAADVSGPNTGWQQRGTWTVPGVTITVTANSVTPSSGSLASQTFALQYSDTAGVASLQLAYAYFNATLASSASNSCFLYYNVAANQINLLNDAGAAWMAAIPGSATTLQNSQCSLNVATTSVALNGNTLTLNLAITFKPAYAGAKNIYIYAADVSGPNSGWQQLGTWTVPSGGTTVTANSVTPSSGSLASQTFALQYSDTAGASSLQLAYAYFNATLASSASNSCFLYYNVAANQINLLNDAGAAWMTATPGAATTLQNSQCSLNVAGTLVALNGNTLTLNLAMTFQPAFAGAKNIYMYAADISGPNSGWQQPGTWTVPSGVVTVTANSVTPSSGSLASQTFALQYSDTSGAASLQLGYAYFNATLASSAANSCFLYYNVAANQINLLNDAGTAWMTATPGAATTLQNSQCSLDVAGASVALNGNTLTLNLAMTFQHAYAGAKNIYLYGADGSGPNSGWQQLGTWTVP